MTLYRNTNGTLARRSDGKLMRAPTQQQFEDCCCHASGGHCCGPETLVVTFSNKQILSLDYPGLTGSELDHLLGDWMLDTRGHYSSGWCVWDYEGPQYGYPMFDIVHWYMPGTPASPLGGQFICETWSNNDPDTWDAWTSYWVPHGLGGPNCWPLAFEVIMYLGNAEIKFDVSIEPAP